MNNQFRPMLAYPLEEADLPLLKYPLILQPKLDGIRCVILEGRALSRTLKPIPNRYIRSKLESSLKIWPYVIDGELIIKNKSFNNSQSEIMTEKGEPNFTYVIFDCILRFADEKFEHRWVNNFPLLNFLSNREFINSANCYNLEDLLSWEKIILRDGNEGIILRSPHEPYKFGRSTLREQGLMKFKRFKDSEAIILDSIEQVSNANNLELDERGYSKRSSAKANLIPTGKLGAWLVEDCNPESEFYEKYFQVGTGFTDKQRKEYWRDRADKKNKIITYKHTPFGAKDKPRSPVFVGFRKD